MTLDEDCLVAENEMRPMPGKRMSAGVGLKKLAERYRLSTGLEVSWDVSDGTFRVRIPLSRAA